MERVEHNRWAVLGALVLGYIAVYLGRKNLAVAIPLLEEHFHASKATVGAIESVGTITYAIGKILGGIVVDRAGGRTGFLASLLGVALFTALTGLAPSLGWIVVLYAANRTFGAGTWGSMLKLLPSWFTGPRVATAIAVLSLSYVLGGACATMLARSMVPFGYRAIFAAPVVPILVVALVTARLVRPGPHATPSGDRQKVEPAAYLGLLRNRTLLLACGISFVTTLLREAFNTWSVHFLTQANGGTRALAVAAMQSTGFDIAGALGILAMGAAYTRLGPRRGLWLMVASLGLLAPAIWVLRLVGTQPIAAAAVLALVGFLLLGPFSLLGGLLSLDAGGPRMAATAAGLTDGVGYVASALAGAGLGRMLDHGGYDLALAILAALALVAALLASRLRLA